VKAIIQAILDHPEGFNGEIIVADNGQRQYGSEGNGGNLDWENNNAVDHSQSIQEVVDFYPKYVSTYLWDSITTVEVDEYSQGNMDDGYIIEDTVDTETGLLVSYPKFTTKYGTYVSFKNGIWNETTKKYDTEKLKVINVPVLKTHCNYGVTGSVKHYMGIPSEIITSSRGYSSHNAVRTGGMGTLMIETRFPILNILDCIWVNANPLSGPMTEYDAATEVNIIAASTDPIALDYWASKNVLIKTCIEAGNTQVSSMNPDKTRFGSFGNWLRLSMQEINRGGFNTTMVEENIIIYMNSAN
jgi:hypothetical protein